MLLLSFPIDSPINIVMEQKVMKMNACWFWKWMMSTAAGLQTHMHMDGLKGARMLPASTGGCAPMGLAMHRPGTKDTTHKARITRAHPCQGRQGSHKEWKHSTPERITEAPSAPALCRVKYYPLFCFIMASLLAYLLAVSGWIPLEIARYPEW